MPQIVYIDPDEPPSNDTGCLKPLAILLAVLVAFVVIGAFTLIPRHGSAPTRDDCSAEGCGP